MIIYNGPIYVGYLDILGYMLCIWKCLIKVIVVIKVKQQQNRSKNERTVSYLTSHPKSFPQSQLLFVISVLGLKCSWYVQPGLFYNSLTTCVLKVVLQKSQMSSFVLGVKCLLQSSLVWTLLLLVIFLLYLFFIAILIFCIKSVIKY